MPPLDAGVDHETVACPVAGVAETRSGTLGVPAGALGVSAVEAAEAGPLPLTLEAMTLKVYAVPLDRPLIVHERVPLVEQVYEAVAPA